MSFCLDGLCYALASGWLAAGLFFSGWVLGAAVRAAFSRFRSFRHAD